MSSEPATAEVDACLLLDAVGALVTGANEHPPFDHLLRFLEGLPGCTFAALYLSEMLQHGPPLLFSPSAELDGNGAQVPAPGFPAGREPPSEVVFALSDPRCEGLEPAALLPAIRAPRGFADLLVANITGSTGLHARLVLGVDTPGAARHRALLGALQRYLTPLLDAFHYQRYLESCARLHDELVTRVGIGEIQVNRTGEVVHTNLMADAVLEEGHLLRCENRRLHCPDGSGDRQLQAALEAYLTETHRPPSGPIYLQSREPYDVIGVLIRQLPILARKTATETPVAALYLGDHVRRMALSTDLLRKLFDLSAAEARVAVQLARGRSPREAAGALHISTNTVRTHLARIFAKTGVQRQSELTALLVSTLGAVWMEPETGPTPDR